MPRGRKSSRAKEKKSSRKQEALKNEEEIDFDIEASIESSRRRKKGLFPIFTICVCGCLLCCLGGLISYGVYRWFKAISLSGPIYNKKPIVDITSPTGGDWFVTDENSIKLSGVAYDEADKLKKVEWEVSGGNSGNAKGTKIWEAEAIPLQEGDNKITIRAYDWWGNVGEDSVWAIYNKDVVFKREMKLSPDFLFKGDPPVDISVSVTVTSKSGEISTVKLYKVNENGEITRELGDMLDNGKITSGDDIPYDGTYSYKGSFSSSTQDPTYLRAVAQTQGSNTSNMSTVGKIIVIEHIEQEFQDEMDRLNQQVSDLVISLEEQGFAQSEIANRINQWMGQQSAIDSHGISEKGQGVWWVYEDTCVAGGILLNPSDTKGGEVIGNASLKSISNTQEKRLINQFVTKVEAQSNPHEVQSLQAIYLGPYLDEFGEEDDYYGAWEQIKASTCPTYDLVEKKNKEVTVEDFKGLDQYGLIVISSHGDNWYGGLSKDSKCSSGLEYSQPIIYSGQDLTSENIKKYEADLMAQRLAVSADGKLVILPAFISHYNLSFPRSLVYVSACRSAYNNKLATAFLGKGAFTYFGFNDYVLSSYSRKIGEQLFKSFVLEGKNASTSFSDSITNFGESDSLGTKFLSAGEDVLKIDGTYFKNLGFEEGEMIGWGNTGDAQVISSLGSISPFEGNYMAIISTGLGSVKDSTSTISQSVCYKGSGGTLKFDYNIVSEEPKEYINSIYDDRLEVYLEINGENKSILSQGVNDSVWQAIADLDFAGGDDTTYQTGWETFTYNLGDVKESSNLKIRFEISDTGDSAFDTAVLIDNIRIE